MLTVSSCKRQRFLQILEVAFFIPLACLRTSDARFKDSFDLVCYTAGNHDLWVRQGQASERSSRRKAMHGNAEGALGVPRTPLRSFVRSARSATPFRCVCGLCISAGPMPVAFCDWAFYLATWAMLGFQMLSVCQVETQGYYPCFPSTRPLGIRSLTSFGVHQNRRSEEQEARRGFSLTHGIQSIITFRHTFKSHSFRCGCWAARACQGTGSPNPPELSLPCLPSLEHCSACSGTAGKR